MIVSGSLISSICINSDFFSLNNASATLGVVPQRLFFNSSKPLRMVSASLTGEKSSTVFIQLKRLGPTPSRLHLFRKSSNGCLVASVATFNLSLPCNFLFSRFSALCNCAERSERTSDSSASSALRSFFNSSTTAVLLFNRDSLGRIRSISLSSF